MPIERDYTGYTCGPCVRTFGDAAEFNRHRNTTCVLRKQAESKPSGRVLVAPEKYAEMMEDARLGKLVRRLFLDNELTETELDDFARLVATERAK